MAVKPIPEEPTRRQAGEIKCDLAGDKPPCWVEIESRNIQRNDRCERGGQYANSTQAASPRPAPTRAATHRPANEPECGGLKFGPISPAAAPIGPRGDKRSGACEVHRQQMKGDNGYEDRFHVMYASGNLDLTRGIRGFVRQIETRKLSPADQYIELELVAGRRCQGRRAARYVRRAVSSVG